MQQEEATMQIQPRSDGGKSILIRKSDGTEQRIELSKDGDVVSSTVSGATATADPPPTPMPIRNKALPDGLVDMMGIIMGAITLTTLGTPLVKAWARRFERRQEVQQHAQIDQRLAAIEQAIETVAIEVERISEGQRFTTKLLAERPPVELERLS